MGKKSEPIPENQQPYFDAKKRRKKIINDHYKSAELLYAEYIADIEEDENAEKHSNDYFGSDKDYINPRLENPL